MKFNKTLASMAAAAALLAAPLASQAAFQLKISDGVLPDLIVTDNGAGDLSGASGVINFNSTFGDYEIVVSVGTSTYDPLSMHLGAVVGNIAPGGIGGALTIELTQTGLALGSPGPVQVYTNGGGSGPGSVTWSSFVDASDTAFGTGTTIHTNVGYNGSGSGTVNTTGFYSATIRTVFDYTSVTTTTAGSLDIDLKVPEPGTIALAGLALLGLGLSRRRQA